MTKWLVERAGYLSVGLKKVSVTYLNGNSIDNFGKVKFLWIHKENNNYFAIRKRLIKSV